MENQSSGIWKISLSLTLLDIGLLSFVCQELIQFFLIGIAELGEVELGWVHFEASRLSMIGALNLELV